MFNNANHALVWAFETTTRQIVKMGAINNMRQLPARGMLNPLLIGLGVEEMHAQAAAIIGMVERLPYKEQTEYLVARFGRKLEPADLTVLVYRGCDASGLGLGSQEPVYRIMRSYFSGNIPYRTVQKMLGCRNAHALMVKHCLYEVMDHIHDRAMADITEVFEQHGLIRTSAMQS